MVNVRSGDVFKAIVTGAKEDLVYLDISKSLRKVGV
jgi:hypothetical protein